MSKKKFSRVLLKLSGEALAAGNDSVSAEIVKKLATNISAVNKAGIALTIVIGGGNLWRFRDNRDATFLPREQSDQLGMLATVMNGVVLGAALRAQGCDTAVFSALTVPVAQAYFITQAQAVLEFGGIAIVVGGTGNPYFTTDTAAALRAVELHCDRVLKATNVDGVYSADPHKNKSAQLYKKLSYAEIKQKKLRVMDDTAFALLAEHQIPLTVFNFQRKGLLLKAAKGQNVGTVVGVN